MAALLMGLLACLLAQPALVVDGATATVTIAGSASPLLVLAKAELERYGAQTTTTLVGASGSELRLLLLDLSEVADDAAAIQLHRCSATHGTNLQPQEHVVHRCSDNSDSAHHFLLVGGDAAGTLHAAYHFTEHVLGVGFSIAGDRLPTVRPLSEVLLHAAALSTSGRRLGTVVSPRFSMRGIQPFHDFRKSYTGPARWRLGAEGRWHGTVSRR
jgi:hypothetical protein